MRVAVQVLDELDQIRVELIGTLLAHEVTNVVDHNHFTRAFFAATRSKRAIPRLRKVVAIAIDCDNPLPTVDSALR